MFFAHVCFWYIFNFYLIYKVEEAVRKRLDISHLGSAANIVLGDTKDQYLLFKQVEPFLRDPIAFRNQDIYCFSHDDRRHLIYTYYRYDAEFMRKILGRYLSKGMRKDLDEVAEEVKLTLSSCCRQVSLSHMRNMFEDICFQLCLCFMFIPTKR